LFDPSSSNSSLLKKAQAGDKASFEALIAPILPRLFNLAFQLTRNHDDAGDAVQDSVIKAYRSLGSFRGESEIFTWLSRILRNTILDEFKKAARRYEEAVETIPEPFGGLGGLCGLDRSIETRHEERELASLLKETIDELSPKLREPLVMYDLEGFSYEEIASTLEINVGTVKSRLSRARETLRIKVKNRGKKLEGYLPKVAEERA
jgi:RNA polymerase sigma-70 factor (ECF subfamily)